MKIKCPLTSAWWGSVNLHFLLSEVSAAWMWMLWRKCNCFVKGLRFWGRGVMSEEFSFMQQWVLSLADAVVKRGLNLGGRLTWFERTPSPADYNEPLSRWPAAERSITAAQLFSVWEQSPRLRGTACILERVSVSVQLLRGKLKRQSQFSLGPLERKDHKGHGVMGTPVFLCCCFADCPKSWIVLFEWGLWKTATVWLHRNYYLSQHERKTDCDNSVAPLTVTVTDDRGWWFISPRKMRNTIIQSLYAHSIPPQIMK